MRLAIQLTSDWQPVSLMWQLQCHYDMLKLNHAVCLSTVQSVFSTCAGFAQRLEKELQDRVPSCYHVHVRAAPERQYGAWKGGALLARSGWFQEAGFVTDAQYHEQGPSVVHRWCF